MLVWNPARMMSCKDARLNSLEIAAGGSALLTSRRQYTSLLGQKANWRRSHLRWLAMKQRSSCTATRIVSDFFLQFDRQNRDAHEISVLDRPFKGVLSIFYARSIPNSLANQEAFDFLWFCGQLIPMLRGM